MLRKSFYFAIILSYVLMHSLTSSESKTSQELSKKIYPSFQSNIQYLSFIHGKPQLSSSFSYKENSFIVIFVPATEHTHTMTEDFKTYIEFMKNLQFKDKYNNVQMFIMTPLQDKISSATSLKNVSDLKMSSLKKEHADTLASFIEWLRQDRAYKQSTIIVIGDKGGNHIINQATHLKKLSKPIDIIIELYPTLLPGLQDTQLSPATGTYNHCFLLYSDHVIKPNYKIMSDFSSPIICRTILPLLDNQQVSHDDFFKSLRWPQMLYSICQLASQEYPHFKHSIYHASSNPRIPSTLILKNNHPFSNQSDTSSQKTQLYKSTLKEKELENKLSAPITKALSYSAKTETLYRKEQL